MPNSGESTTGLRILVVEDESLVAAEIQDRLTRLRFQVIGVCDTAEQGILAAEEQHPDLVLMDIRLKGKTDGIAAADHIYRQFDIPVVYLTAHSDQATLQRAMSTSPFGYVLKPFQEQDLQVAIEIAVRSNSLNLQLKEQVRHLQALSLTDALTGLPNRRAFDQRLDNELNHAARYKSPLSLLFLDVDHFKAYNDTFGHPAGDAVLQDLAQLMRWYSRNTDFPARYGGEEFAVLLQHTDRADALVVAERLRQATAAVPNSHRAVTISIGVVTLAAGMDGATFIAQADKAMYEAKRRGRNCVVNAGNEL